MKATYCRSLHDERRVRQLMSDVLTVIIESLIGLVKNITGSSTSTYLFVLRFSEKKSWLHIEVASRRCFEQEGEFTSAMVLCAVVLTFHRFIILFTFSLAEKVPI